MPASSIHLLSAGASRSQHAVSGLSKCPGEFNRSDFLKQLKGITMNRTQEEKDKKMSQIIAKCWADEGFKKKLLADATGTLKAEGEELPAGLSYKAVENTDKVVHLVIPFKPTELSE